MTFIRRVLFRIRSVSSINTSLEEEEISFTRLNVKWQQEKLISKYSMTNIKFGLSKCLKTTMDYLKLQPKEKMADLVRILTR